MECLLDLARRLIVEGREGSKERRKYKRSKGTDGTLSAILTQDMLSYTTLADIVDISESGVALRYEERNDQRIGESTFLDIFAYRGRCMHLEKLPCDVIYDIAADTDGSGTRRCGLRFCTLSPPQQSRLTRFIREHTQC